MSRRSTLESGRHPSAGPPSWTEDFWDDTELLPEFTVERLPRNRRWIRWLPFVLAVVLIAGIIFGGGVGLWLARQLNPPGDPGERVTFTVNANDTLESVADRMETQGIITNADVFVRYVKQQSPLTLVPGYYLIRPRDTMGNIIKRLRIPPELTYTKVTFPEGFTLNQMSRRLTEKMTTLNADAFLAATADGSVRYEYAPEVTNLEGLLFPDTYEVAGNETEAQVVQTMVDLMERVSRQEDVVEKSYGRGFTAYQALTIASIIEREAQTSADRYKISRVIYNRLALGMPLELDATLYYGQDSSRPFDELKAIDTPYNTYLHTGLPPTPIANPGRDSIRAAVNPDPNPGSGDPICVNVPVDQQCQYLFYVLSPKGDGSHVFAATYEDHLRNVEAARAAGVLG